MAKKIERITIQPHDATRDWVALSQSPVPISGQAKKKWKNVILRDDAKDSKRNNLNRAKIDRNKYIYTHASSLYICTEALEGRGSEGVNILKELMKYKCLSELNIYKIPCEIGNCDLWSKLNTVRLVDTGLCSVPSTILQSRSLHFIDFSGSDFSKLAQIDFSGVPNLRVLIMCRSRLRVIPNVSNNTHLQVLDLSINLITSPWAGWGTHGESLFPKGLVTLCLNDNHLTDFPEFPSTLKCVFLSNNFAVHDKYDISKNF